MSESSGRTVEIIADGRRARVPAGASVAAALLNLGAGAFRTSVGGQARAPLCGMGICFECRATVDGVAHRRTCMVPVRGGMEVKTDDGG